MPLPDFHDQRPYTHPEHPGTWRIIAIGPTLITLRRTDNSTVDVAISTWPGDWLAHEHAAQHDTRLVGHRQVGDGIYRLTDPHTIYAVPSTSTDRIHQVTVNTRTGAMRCDGPRCYGRTCSHQKRVLAVRAGF